MARYLVAGGMAEDPEQGYEFTQAARRLAARVGVVREASGIAAYQTGRWAEALSELRAARRLTGRADYLPLMADSERALGRLDRALALIREADDSELDRPTLIELRIVESGIRRDQGLADAAVIALQVPELNSRRLRPWSARLFYAYGDALLAAGRPEEARDAFARAAAADPDGETDAADRLDELDGFEFEDLADYEDEDEFLDDEDDEDDDDEDGALSGREAIAADDDEDGHLEDAHDLEGAVEEDVEDDAASSETELTDETEDDEIEGDEDDEEETEDDGPDLVDEADEADEPAEPDQASAEPAEAPAEDGPASPAPEHVTDPQ